MPPSAEAPRRRRWPVMLGWVLAVPGLWVIASFVLVGSGAPWADCVQRGALSLTCPPTVLGELAQAMWTSLMLSMLFSFVGIGVVPPLYSFVWVVARIIARLHARQAPEGP